MKSLLGKRIEKKRETNKQILICCWSSLFVHLFLIFVIIDGAFPSLLLYFPPSLPPYFPFLLVTLVVVVVVVVAVSSTTISSAPSLPLSFTTNA